MPQKRTHVHVPLGCSHPSVVSMMESLSSGASFLLGKFEGSPAIDYYVSADVLESPDRTRTVPEDESYTEQVRRGHGMLSDKSRVEKRTLR